MRSSSKATAGLHGADKIQNHGSARPTPTRITKATRKDRSTPRSSSSRKKSSGNASGASKDSSISRDPRDNVLYSSIEVEDEVKSKKKSVEPLNLGDKENATVMRGRSVPVSIEGSLLKQSLDSHPLPAVQETSRDHLDLSADSSFDEEHQIKERNDHLISTYLSSTTDGVVNIPSTQPINDTGALSSATSLSGESNDATSASYVQYSAFNQAEIPVLSTSNRIRYRGESSFEQHTDLIDSNEGDVNSSLARLLQDRIRSLQDDNDKIAQECKKLREEKEDYRYKYNNMNERMQTAIHLAESSKVETERFDKAKQFLATQMESLDKAHKETLSENTSLQQEVVQLKLENSKLTSDITSVNEAKSMLEIDYYRLKESQPHVNDEVDSLRRQLIEVRQAMEERSRNEQSEYVVLQELIQKEKTARIQAKENNRVLSEDAEQLRRDMNKYESLLEESRRSIAKLNDMLTQERDEKLKMMDDYRRLLENKNDMEVQLQSQIRTNKETVEDCNARLLSMQVALEGKNRELNEYHTTGSEKLNNVYTELQQSKLAHEKTTQEHSYLVKTSKQHEDNLTSLTSKLQSMSQELLFIKSEKDALQHKLSNSDSALSNAHSNVKSLHEVNSEQSKKIDELMRDLNDTKAGHKTSLNQLVRDHQDMLHRKLSEHNDATRESVAQQLREVHKESSEELIKKHIMIVDQLSNMHTSEIEEREADMVILETQHADELASLESALNDKEQEFEETKKQLQQQFESDMEQQKEQLRQLMDTHDQEKGALSSEKENLQQDYDKMSDSMSTLKEQLTTMEKEKETATQDLEKAKEQLSQLSLEKERAEEEHTQLNDRISVLAKQVSDLNIILSSHQAKLSEYEEEHLPAKTLLEQQIESLSTQLSTKDTELEEVRSELMALQGEHKGLRSDLEKQLVDKETALENLGETVTDGQKTIEQLKEEIKSMETTKLQLQKKLQQTMTEKLNNEKQLEHEKNERDDQINVLKSSEDSLNKQVTELEQAKEVYTKEKVEMQKVIDEKVVLERQMKQLTEESEEQKRKHGLDIETLQSLEKDLEKRDKELKEYQSQATTAERNLKTNSKRIEELERALSLKEETLTTTNEQLSASTQENSLLNHQLESLSSSEVKLQQEVQNKDTKLASLSKRVTSLQTELDSQREKYSQIHDEKHRVLQELEEHKVSLDDHRIEIQKHIKDLDTHKTLLDEHRNEGAVHKQALGHHKSLVERHKEEYDSLKDELESHKNKHAEEISKLQDIHNETVVNTVTTMENKINRLESTIKYHEEKAKEKDDYYGDNMKKLQMKHSDALETHNRAIQEHLSAEELLWKEKETLKQAHNELANKHQELQTKIHTLETEQSLAKQSFDRQLIRAQTDAKMASEELQSLQSDYEKLEKSYTTLQSKSKSLYDAKDEERHKVMEENETLKINEKKLNRLIQEKEKDISRNEEEWQLQRQQLLDDVLQANTANKVSSDDAKRRYEVALQDAEQRYQDAMKQLNDAVEDRESMIEKLTTIHNKTLQTKEKDYLNTIESLQHGETELRQQLATIRSNNTSLNSNVETLQDEITRLNNKLKLEHSKEERYSERVSLLENQLENVRSEMVVKQQEMDEVKAASVAINRKLVSAQQEINTYTSDIESSKMSYMTMKQRLEQELQQAHLSLQETSQQYQNVRTERHGDHSNIQTLHAHIAGQTDTINKYREQTFKLESVIQELQRELSLMRNLNLYNSTKQQETQHLVTEPTKKVAPDTYSQAAYSQAAYNKSKSGTAYKSTKVAMDDTSSSSSSSSNSSFNWSNQPHGAHLVPNAAMVNILQHQPEPCHHVSVNMNPFSAQELEYTQSGKGKSKGASGATPFDDHKVKANADAKTPGAMLREESTSHTLNHTVADIEPGTTVRYGSKNSNSTSSNEHTISRECTINPFDAIIAHTAFDDDVQDSNRVAGASPVDKRVFNSAKEQERDSNVLLTDFGYGSPATISSRRYNYSSKTHASTKTSIGGFKSESYFQRSDSDSD